MTKVTIKQLLEAGVHFGHQTQRWNPKMKKYIFGHRNGIYIINLEITLSCLETTLEFLKSVAAEGREILFVGTKRQAQEPLRAAAQRCEMPYVEQRWLGGMLTNFQTLQKSVAKLEHIERSEQSGEFKFITKKEASLLKKEREKLLKNLGGIRNMRQIPGAIFVIDSKKEEIAVHEATKLGIPVAAVLDTNCDPDKVNYPLPGNDDAIRAIRLFCDLAAEAAKEGRDQYKLRLSAQQAEESSQEEALATAGLEPSFEAQLAAKGEGAEVPGEGVSAGDEIQEAQVLVERVEEKLAEAFTSEMSEADKEKLKLKKTPRKEGGKSKLS